ncbi:putative transmembrane alpha-helix domain-containing protein [Erysiphe necator]|uniref:Putative transmembrane alpha-helix domain-containing protein n=1 Tax=Uncinula necator TaxID=52586 RepID=A0A0B1P9Y6_UNCNE|nr:putative transmembrane alpha-helix domain-containing protein [Erysiphe necator]
MSPCIAASEIISESSIPLKLCRRNYTNDTNMASYRPSIEPINSQYVMSNATSTNAHVAPPEVAPTSSSMTAASETLAPTTTPSPNPAQPATTSSTVPLTTVPNTSPNTSPPPASPTPDQPPSNTQGPNPPQSPSPNPSPNPAPNPSPNPSPKPPVSPTDQPTQPTDPPPPKSTPGQHSDTTITKTQVTPENTAAPSFVTVTLSPTSPGGSSIVTIIQTSTHAGNPGSKSASSQSSSPTSTPELQRDPSDGSNNGLSGGTKIAVAVIIPLLAVTLFVLAALFMFRRRKQRKHAEELRRKEVEEYGYNPNQDPTFPVIESLDGNNPQEMREENAGYRGWGATAPVPGRINSNKMSPNSNPATVAGIGIAYSEGESPTHGTISDTKSDNPLISELNGSNNERHQLGNMGPTVKGNDNGNINRGNSNASSSYSAANRSDESGEINGRYYGQQYSPENYSGLQNNATTRVEMPAQPIIRDVQARRNTRIESPSHFPPQSTGISQNF